MSWQVIALGAYFLLAIVGVVDKILVSGPIRSPAALAFYTSVLALAIFALAPFVGISWPGISQLLLACSSGFLFSLALLLYFRAVKKQEISRVVPGIAGFAPILTLLFSIVLFHEAFSPLQLVAFALLVCGGVFITLERGVAQLANMRNVAAVIAAALAFSLSFVLIEAVYDAQPFWSGFMWSRVGGGIFALLILLHRGARAQIFKKTATIPSSGKALFMTNQVVASGAFILQNFAFSLGPVALVYALESTRHFFLLLFASIVSKVRPALLKERTDRATVAYKIAALAFIMVGLFLMFY